MQFGDGESASSIIKFFQLSSSGTALSGHITLCSSRLCPHRAPSALHSQANQTRTQTVQNCCHRAPANLDHPPSHPDLTNKHRRSARLSPRRRRIPQQRRDFYRTKAALVSPPPRKGEERRNRGFNSNHTFSCHFATRDAQSTSETFPLRCCLSRLC